MESTEAQTTGECNDITSALRIANLLNGPPAPPTNAEEPAAPSPVMQPMLSEILNQPRERRRHLAPDQKKLLKHWFNNHISHPYVTAKERKELSKDTGLTESQITTWLINERARNKDFLRRGRAMQNDMRY